ncbi:MAPEG family protein [Microbulbifer sp. DLAB2-AF]|uniref:MAPEG family protein n=1 Tax=Microbulbifer sp. DLAB2-AF TaxID=3243395 RepID=UPI00403A2C26
MELDQKQRKAIKLVTIYPFALFIISTFINLPLADIGSTKVSLPSVSHLHIIIISALILTGNHSLLMTSTEITRVKFKMYSTPEEWQESGNNREVTSELAISELKRNHNAHRNLTENTCIFTVLAIPFLLISPPLIITSIWIIGFAMGRLGHSIAYLAGKTGLRGLFMSISLLATYGIASYLICAWFI